MSSFDTATAYLSKLVRTAARSGAVRLPTLVVLARSAGVSVQTMFRAVAVLKSGGILEAHPRRGITLVHASRSGGVVAEPIVAPARTTDRELRSRAGDVRNRLLHDIAGRFFGGSDTRILPSVKQLTERYGTCFQIMSGVLRALVTEGVIERHKRQYRLASALETARPSSLLLITDKRFAMASSMQMDQHAEFLRSLERECGRHRLGIDIVTVDRIGNVLSHPSLRTIGALVWPHGLPSSVLGSILLTLAARRVPAALWEQTALAPRMIAAATAKRFLVCSSTTDYEAGQAVGRYAVALGPGGVSYFSPFHGSIWCRERLAGIADAFAAAGRTADLRACTLDHVGLDEIAERLASLPGYAAIARDIHRSCGLLGRTLGTTGHYLTDRLNADHTGLYLQSLMEPLFEKALATRDDSVWIGVNDFVVLRARAWRSQNRARAARPVQLVGFDDSVEAFARGIPSYSFNIPALVTAMVGYVLGDRSVVMRPRDNRLKIPGELILRDHVRLGLVSRTA